MGEVETSGTGLPIAQEAENRRRSGRVLAGVIMHLFLLAMLQRLKTIERSRMLHRTDETDPAASKLATLRESSAGVLCRGRNDKAIQGLF